MKKIKKARRRSIRKKLAPIFRRAGMWLAWAPINNAYVFMFGDSPIKMDMEPMFFQYLESAKAAAVRHGLVVNEDMSVSATADRSLNPTEATSPLVPAVVATALGVFAGWLTSRSRPFLALATVGAGLMMVHGINGQETKENPVDFKKPKYGVCDLHPDCQNNEELAITCRAHRKPRRVVSYETIYQPWGEGDDEPDRETHDYGDHEIEPPDEDEEEEGIGWVEKTVKYLDHEGVSPGYADASSSSFHPGVWYMFTDEQNYRTGETSERTFHLEGFPIDEERAIYTALTRRTPVRLEHTKGTPCTRSRSS